MNNKIIVLACLLIINISAFSQRNTKVSESPLDTLNGLVYGCYPEIHFSQLNGLPDSLLIMYPNRSHVNFDNLPSSKRDSLVAVHWKKLYNDFNNSVNFDSVNIDRKTKSFFFTLHFGLDGKLKYLFYNWNKYPENNELFNQAFIHFVSNYDFSGFPQGKAWSQCGTFSYKKKRFR